MGDSASGPVTMVPATDAQLGVRACSRASRQHRPDHDVGALFLRHDVPGVADPAAADSGENRRQDTNALAAALTSHARHGGCLRRAAFDPARARTAGFTRSTGAAEPRWHPAGRHTEPPHRDEYA